MLERVKVGKKSYIWPRWCNWTSFICNQSQTEENPEARRILNGSERSWVYVCVWARVCVWIRRPMRFIKIRKIAHMRWINTTPAQTHELVCIKIIRLAVMIWLLVKYTLYSVPIAFDLEYFLCVYIFSVFDLFRLLLHPKFSLSFSHNFHKQSLPFSLSLAKLVNMTCNKQQIAAIADTYNSP